MPAANSFFFCRSQKKSSSRPWSSAPFDAAEVRLAGRAVHLGRAVGVDRPPVMPDYRVPQAPAHRARRRSLLPGSGDDLDQPVEEELDILARLHHAFFGNVVFAFLGHRAVWVCVALMTSLRASKSIASRAPGRGAAAGPAGETPQVAGEQNRLVQAAIALAGLDGHGRGRDRVVRSRVRSAC